MLELLVLAANAGFLPSQAQICGEMDVLAARALGLLLAAAAREDERDSPDLEPADAAARRLDELLDGGTLDAGDRAEILLHADDLLSIAWVRVLLGEPVDPRLGGASLAVRGRLWRASEGVVAMRLLELVEEETAERDLVLDPIGASLWAEPDAPAVRVLPSVHASSMSVRIPLGEDTSDEPAVEESLALAAARLSMGALPADLRDGALPEGSVVVFPPGGGVEGLPVVLVGTIGDVPAVVVSGAEIVAAYQDAEKLPVAGQGDVYWVEYPWSTQRGDGPVHLELRAGPRVWSIALAKP